MKIKVEGLEGAQLDYWVARAEGKGVTTEGCDPVMVEYREPFVSGWEPYAPSTDWSQGGPIIEREGITICPAHPKGWSATIDDERWEDDCATPLIAAMRCYVASKFGEEVGEA